MKILYGSCRYYPGRGGAEASFMRLVAEVAHSHEVLVITQETEGLGGRGSYQDAFGGTVIRLPYYFRNGETMDPEINRRVFQDSLEVAQRMRPDVIHGNYLDHFTWTLSRVAARLRVPYIQTVCGSDVFLSGLDPQACRMGRLACENAATVIAKSSDLKRRAIADFHLQDPKVVVIPNGVDLERTAKGAGLSDGKRYVLAIGQARWAKGYDLLGGVASMLQWRDPDLRICVVGDGSDLSRLHYARAAGRLTNLTILGARAPRECLAYLERSMFLITTSHFEGCPNVVLEAFASAKPVVGFDTPGVRNLVRHGRNGLLVPYPDLAALAEAIHRLAHHAGLRRKLGAGAYRTVGAPRFRWKRVARCVLASYAAAQTNSSRGGKTM